MRSLVASRSSFNSAVVLSIAHYLGLIGSLTASVISMRHPGPHSVTVVLGLTTFTLLTWLLALVKRRHTFCPLCKGTPLINTSAHPHASAFRIWPFNHGVSATLSIITTGKFRCMYCGSNFDLSKVPSFHQKPMLIAEPYHKPKNAKAESH